MLLWARSLACSRIGVHVLVGCSDNYILMYAVAQGCHCSTSSGVTLFPARNLATDAMPSLAAVPNWASVYGLERLVWCMCNCFSITSCPYLSGTPSRAVAMLRKLIRSGPLRIAVPLMFRGRNVSSAWFPLMCAFWKPFPTSGIPKYRKCVSAECFCHSHRFQMVGCVVGRGFGRQVGLVFICKLSHCSRAQLYSVPCNARGVKQM
jgi:hypothetical protein